MIVNTNGIQLHIKLSSYLFQTNTFQAIIITDGQSSFALFTYNCLQMEWSGDVGIGANGDGRFYANHVLSKTENAHQIACLNSPSSDWSNVLYELCKFL
jgi:hypothetical protein